MHILKSHLTILIFFSLSTGLAAELKPIYDAQLDLFPAEPSATELAWLKSNVLPRAQKHWEENNCEESFTVIDKASGAFTKPNVQQDAYLYYFCETGDQWRNWGLAIVDTRKLVMHLFFEEGRPNALGKLPDINQNQVAELIIEGGYIHQGYYSEVIDIIELLGRKVKKFGQITTAHDDCGATDNGTRTEYRLYAKPAPTPIFYRETFSGGCEGDHLKKRGGRKEVTLDKDEIIYTLDAD